jgi:hypothetical protein
MPCLDTVPVSYENIYYLINSITNKKHSESSLHIISYLLLSDNTSFEVAIKTQKCNTITECIHHFWTQMANFLILLECCHFLFGLDFNKESHDSSVGIALGYGLDDWGSRIQFLVGAGNVSLHHCVQNSSGAHPASYLMGTRGSFSGGKAAGA